jgi:hypothetical protein
MPLDWSPYEKLFTTALPKDGVVVVVARWCPFSHQRMPEFLKKYPGLRLIDNDVVPIEFPGLEGYPTAYKVTTNNKIAKVVKLSS